MNEKLTPYPFTANENKETVEEATSNHMLRLIQSPLFESVDRANLLSSFKTYYAFSSMLFNEEEELRAQNVPGANLYYHGREHAIQQVTYDAISIVSEILKREDAFSNHLTVEGALSIILGAMFHDTGYVSDGPVENYAARTPIHVEESMKMFQSTLNLLGLPEEIDIKKVIKVGKIGIHGTHFPFTQKRTGDKPEIQSRLEEAELMMQELSIEEKKEAQIVRLSVQLADLGGQCARKDYFPTQVLNLRRELDSVAPDLGRKVVGNDNELVANREFFLNTFVLQRPLPVRNVETTALSFFGPETSKPFRDAWTK